MDFRKRLELLELMVKDALRLSQGSIPHEVPIRSLLDEISQSVLQLKKEFERSEISSGSRGLDQARNDTITVSDMGYGFLSRYATDFSGKIHVSGLDSFDLVEISTRLADPDAPSSLTLQHSSTSEEGISQLYLARRASFKFPDFSKLPQTAPRGYKKSFDTVINSPPRKPITYYVGPPLTADFNALLSPGALFTLGEIPGITTHYWHAGEKNSGTAFHYEDGAVRSCNITIAGYKLWILIKVSSNKEFEDFIQSRYPPKRPQCGQWLRHLNILISPKTLKEKNIKFDLILAGPGDMVITEPRQYHAVLNLTTCFAIAINFALSVDPVLEPTTVCPKCGLYELKHTALQKLEGQGSPNGVRGPAKRLETRLNQAPVDRQPLRDASLSGLCSEGATRASFDASSSGAFDGDKRGSQSQGDEVAVAIGPRQDTNEECSRECRDCGQSSALGSPPTSHNVARSPYPPSADASSLYAPSSSVSRWTTPSQSTSAFSSTPPSSLDHYHPTGQSLHTHPHPDIRSDSPSTIATSPTSQYPTALHSGNSPLTGTRPKRVMSHESITKRSRLCLPPTVTNMTDDLLRRDPRCNIPRFDNMVPADFHILRNAAAVRSRYAVQQFYDLVNTKRSLQPGNVLFPTYTGASLAQRLTLLNGLQHSKIMTYINQYLFAVEVDKTRKGSHRVDSTIKKDIINASGLTASTYEKHLTMGNKWRKICGAFEGMMCFILSDKHNPFDISPATYLEMADHELQLFHNLLADDYTEAICAAGKAFQQSLGARDSYFAWENSKLSNPLYELPEDNMLSYIKPVPLLVEDKHDTAEFPDWPDPTHIPLTEKQCNYCSDSSCKCYFSMALKLRPRIMVYPGKGLGLQAISTELGASAYRKNEVIGFLTGKLVPPGTLDNDRMAGFHECQIDCREEGNEFWLMNHACKIHAVARLAKKRVSGRFRQSVLALKSINHGAEITIVYSDETGHQCAGCHQPVTG